MICVESLTTFNEMSLKLDSINKHGSLPFTYHQREDDGHHLDHLDRPQTGKTDHLYEGEEVHTTEAYLTQEHVIWLIFLGHEENQESLHQLETEEHN